MKKIILFIMALMLAIGRGSIGSAAANVWYDPTFDFSTIKSMAVFPVYAPPYDEKLGDYNLGNGNDREINNAIHKMISEPQPIYIKYSPIVEAEIQAMLESEETEVIEVWSAADGSQAPLIEPPEEDIINGLEHPSLLRPFASEAERGAAVRAETEADAYVIYRLEGPYPMEDISYFPWYKQYKKTRIEYDSENDAPKYADCNCTMYSVDGNKILSYSMKLPAYFGDVYGASGTSMYKSLHLSGGEDSEELRSVVGELQEVLATAMNPAVNSGEKTVRAGKVQMNYPGTEAGEILRGAMETAIYEKAAASVRLCATADGESDYTVDADVTECNVRVLDRTISFDKGGYGYEQYKDLPHFHVKVKLAATIRLVDARTGQVALTYAGKAEDDDLGGSLSESEAFGKILDGFYQKVDETLKV